MISLLNKERIKQASGNVDSVSLVALPALISNGRKSLKVNVMLDPCSTSSFVTETATNELPLNLMIAETGGTEVQKQSRRVELSVVNLNGRFMAPLQAYVLDDVAKDTPAIHWSKLKERWPHFRDVPFENVSRRRRIDVMIGSNHSIFHMVLNEIPGAEPSDPIGRWTNLGWVCFGPTLVENFWRDSHSYFSRTYRSRVADQRQPPDDAVRKFWELDAIGIKKETRPPMTAEKNAAANKKVSETLKFLSGRYEIGIPWKDEEPKFVNNYEAAFARLESQEKSPRKKGLEVMQAHNHIFDEYQRKGFIQEVRKSDVKEQWFLPHFPVLRPEKDAITLQSQLSDLLASGGFRLQKWASNNQEVLCHIPEEDRLPSLEINEQETHSTKTLVSLEER